MVARVKHRRSCTRIGALPARLGRGLGISALFFGAPGPASTMVAGLIARELGRPLQIDLSRIVSKWVGETEKHLSAGSRLPRPAMPSSCSTADSCSQAHRREVIERPLRELEVNYLLQRMDRSPHTILRRTTTPRSTRRFGAACRSGSSSRFRKRYERARIWRATLPSKARVGVQRRLRELAEAYEMTGGYIRNAALRAAFFAASAGMRHQDEPSAAGSDLEMASMGKVVAAPWLIPSELRGPPEPAHACVKRRQLTCPPRGSCGLEDYGSHGGTGCPPG